MVERIVVVGAGVSGLTTALELSRNQGNHVTVVAKHMPGDYDIQYASPFAGANVVPMSDEKDSEIERRTWSVLKKLCEQVPEAECQLHRRVADYDNANLSNVTFGLNPWYRNLFDDYRELAQREVLSGYDSGCEFGSICINTTIYLHWLVGQLLKNGVVLKRGDLSDIRQAKGMSHTSKPATIIVNCTGLGSLKLGGVEDANMYPIRGQLVVVRNEMTPMFGVSSTDDGRGEEMYAMQRAAGGGTILGGTYDPGNWESQPDPSIAARIMARIVKARPEIANGKGVGGLSVVRHAVGLRPARKGGVRIEKEKLDADTWIVHNYGHAGWGYQGSYGCAEMVVELVNKIGHLKSETISKL